MYLFDAGGHFLLTATTGGLTYSITGKRAGGVLDNLRISVTDGGKEMHLGANPDKIDAKYRPAVKALLDRGLDK